MSNKSFTAALATTAALLAGMLGTQASHAQAYPSKPVRIVVPVGNGGTSDVLARQLAAKLQQVWGQGVVVENKPGVVGNLGTEIVVKSPPDGYTLVLQSNAMPINQALGVKANFTAEKDLTPIIMLGQTPMILVAHPKLGVSSVKDLLAYEKSRPGTLSYASCGIGGPHHMVMELLKQRAALTATHVAYKGCSPALVDVLGDQVPLAMLSANQVVTHVKAGRLVPLGISSSVRYAPLANVSSFEEQGFKPLDFSNWFALFGPANMPKDVVTKIYRDIAAILKDDGVKSNLSTAGVEVYDGDGALVSRLLKSDQARYEQVAKSAQIKLE